MSGIRSKLILGDSLQALRKMETHSIDHCFTDPPYNISGYDGKKQIGWLKTNKTWEDEKQFAKINESWDSFSNDDFARFTFEWIAEVTRVVKPNGNIMIFGSYHNIYLVGEILRKLDRRVINSIIWYKRNAFPNITQRMLCESTEQIIWSANGTQKKAKNWTFNYHVLKDMTDNKKQMRNMWDIPMTPTSERKFGKHPSQKPLEIGKRLVLGFSNPGDIILDPFAGSGTFLCSAKQFGRRYIGIERELEFVELSKARLKSISS
jgi:site-specific DNA-methyltransferase (adenine-specific)